MKSLFRGKGQVWTVRVTVMPLILVLLLSLPACLPEATGSLFADTATPGMEETETAADSDTPHPSASETASPEVTATSSDTSVSVATPEISPSPAPTETPSPTPTPQPPRFTFASDFNANWDGSSTLPHALVKKDSKLDKYEYFNKLLGTGYKKSDVPAILFSETYENGDKQMTLYQTAFTYQNKHLMDNQTPITTIFHKDADIVAYVTNVLSGMFPEEMLQNGKVESFKSRNGSLYTVTVKYPRSVNGAVIEDAAEGILATVGASGILDMSFQWCDYVADREMVMEGTDFILEELDRLYPNGDPVRIVSARLVYRASDMGVRYLPAWQCTGNDGEKYYVFLN